MDHFLGSSLHKIRIQFTQKYLQSISHHVTVVIVLSIYNVYSMIMSAVKRLPVSEKIWKELGAMKGAGQTYDDLLEDMIERVKKARLEEDVKMWESTPDSEYVSLSEIKD